MFELDGQRNPLVVSMDLSISVIERILAAREGLEQALPDGSYRWVHPERVHLVLRTFHGEGEPAHEHIRDLLQGFAAGLFPFQVECAGFSVDPSPERPRHLFAAISPQNAEVLGLLSRALERDLSEHGFPPETRPFTPRVFLGRFRGLSGHGLRALQQLPDESFGTATVRDLVFQELVWTHRGPRARIIDRLPLGGP